jgi:uncharacterized membrane protein
MIARRSLPEPPTSKLEPSRISRRGALVTLAIAWAATYSAASLAVLPYIHFFSKGPAAWFRAPGWPVWVVSIALLVAAAAAGLLDQSRDHGAVRTRWASALGACFLVLVLAQLTPHAAHLVLPAAAVVIALPFALLVARLRFSGRWLRHPFAAWIGGLLCAAVFFWSSYRRHAAFASGSQDLGLFTQSIWLLSQGFSPENTIMHRNAFADHLEWIDVLVAPLMWLWKGAGALLLVQAVAAGSGAVPVYRIAQRQMRLASAGPLAVVAYLFAHGIVCGILFDWNPTTVSIGFFAWAFEAALDRRYGRMAVFLVLIGLCKENLLLYVAAFGAMLAILGAPWRVVAVTVAASLAAFVVELKIIAPLFRPEGYRHFYYAELGATLPEVFFSVVRHPMRGFALLFTPAQKINGLLLPLSSTAFLGLLSPAALLPMVPGILERFWSDYANTWGTGFHYAGPSHAISLCAALCGAGRARRWLLRHSWSGWGRAAGFRRAAAFFPVATIVAATCLAAGGGSWGPIRLFRRPYRMAAEDRAAIHRALATIPSDAAVAAQFTLVPHLATRRQIYEVRDAEQASYFILSARAPQWPNSVGDVLCQARQLVRQGWRVHFCEGASAVLARQSERNVDCPLLEADPPEGCASTTPSR